MDRIDEHDQNDQVPAANRIKAVEDRANAENSHKLSPFMCRMIREYLEDHRPKPLEKATPDLGQQGRMIADGVDDLRSLGAKIEQFFPQVGGPTTTPDGNPVIGGNTAFQSGMGLTGAIQILQSTATTSDEIEEAIKSSTHTARGVHAMKASRGIIGLMGGVTSTLQAGFSLGAISNTSAAITHGLAALKAASGPLGGIFLSALIIPRCIELNKELLIQKAIKDHGKNGLMDLFNQNPGAIELALPVVYKKLKEGEEITEKEFGEISKGLNESVKMNITRLVLNSVTLLLTVLGAVLTSGIAPLAFLIVGLAVSLITGVVDIKSIIEMLKKAVKLTNKDIVIKVLMIVLALTAAVVSAVLAPSLGLQIAAGVVGGVLALIPVVSLAAVSIKVKRLADERKKQEAQEDYEKFIARALRRIAEKEFAIQGEEKIQQRVDEQFFLLFKHRLGEKKGEDSVKRVERKAADLKRGHEGMAV